MLILTEINIIIDGIYIYSLVFARLSGIIFFNPVFSKNNIPAFLRAGMVFLFTLVLSPVIPSQHISDSDMSLFITGVLSEIAVGLVSGYVLNIFFYMLFVAGDLIDMQSGISMSKVTDPISGIKSSFSGKLFAILFIAYVFITNSHLVLIKIISDSFLLIPAGTASIDYNKIFSFGIEIFISAFSFAIRLSLPFVAVQIIFSLWSGMIMKFVPHSNMFLIDMPLRCVIFISILIISAVPVTSFTENYIVVALENIEKALNLFVLQEG